MIQSVRSFVSARPVEDLDRYRSRLEELVTERTRQLRESEESLHRLFESSPVAMVLTRMRDGVVLEANRRATELFAATPDPLRHHLAPGFWVDPGQLRDMLQKVRAGECVDGFVTQLRRGDGNLFWADVAAQVIQYRGERALLVGVRDVTAQKAAEDALRTLFDAAPLPMVLTGFEDGTIRHANQRAADLFEGELSELLGSNATDHYVNPEERQAFVERLSRIGRVDGHSAQLRTHRGREFWVLMSAKTLEIGGERLFMVGFADFTEQKNVQDALRTLATTDALTGAVNRRRFFELAETELARAARHGHPLSVAMVDVDHFKAVNDQHGHDVGDQVLRAITDAARTSLRRTDTLARYGGEELVVLLPDTHSSGATDVMERVRDAVSQLAHPAGETVMQVTVSIGVATLLPGEGLNAFLRRADQALYAAKQQGRNRVVTS